MTPTFSLEMCRLLSSLTPGFEGHWKYYRNKYPRNPKNEILVYCEELIPHPDFWEYICPAWQAEDVLRSLKTLAPYIKHQDPVPVEIFFKPKVASQEYTICCNHSVKEYVLPWEIMVSELTSLLVMYPDTAYQKIEEYLWTMLK